MSVASLRHDKGKQDEISDKLTRTKYGKVARQISLMADSLSLMFQSRLGLIFYRTEYFSFFGFLRVLQTKTRHSNMIELTSDLLFSLRFNVLFLIHSIQHLQHFT